MINNQAFALVRISLPIGRLVLFLCIGGILLFAPPTQAEPRRYAIVIGSNAGDAGETTLLYAEEDARRIADILHRLGGFLTEDILVLTETNSEEVRRVLLRVNARVRKHGGESLLFVFYSGHGDAESLHLAGTRLAMTELRDFLNGSPATARVLVLDACRSGSLTRVKGGRAGPAFTIQFDDRLGAEGVAILTSSSAGEDSQESDKIKASFFTYYLASALLGAADRNADGAVSLGEAFQYASERTFAATLTTRSGPQHPTYRYALKGREDLLLTRPQVNGKNLGSLEFTERGTYLIQKKNARGQMLAEVLVPEKKRTISLKPGTYFITRRQPDRIYQGLIEVSAGKRSSVLTSKMQRIQYAQVVRKGGTELTSATSLIVQAGARGTIVGLGNAPLLQAGLRFDHRSLSWEIRAGATNSVHQNQFIETSSRELFGSLLLLRAFDLRSMTLSIGIEAGASWLHQDYQNSPQTGQRNSALAFLAPTTQLHLPLSDRFYARLEINAATYLLQGEGRDTAPSWQTPVTWKAGLGLGRFF